MSSLETAVAVAVGLGTVLGWLAATYLVYRRLVLKGLRPVASALLLVAVEGAAALEGLRHVKADSVLAFLPFLLMAVSGLPLLLVPPLPGRR